MDEVVLIAEGLGGIGTIWVGLRIYLFRRRSKPEWKQKRLEHFLYNVELPSTCSKLGHVMMEDKSGCLYCEDLIRLEVTGNPGLMHITGTHYDFVDPESDGRIIAHSPPSPYGRRGYILVDTLSKFNPSNYNHHHQTITEIIEKHKKVLTSADEYDMVF